MPADKVRACPGSVRTAVMLSPVPIDEPFPPYAARYGQRGLDVLIARLRPVGSEEP